MADRYFCPPLQAYVELNDERREHILHGNVDGQEILDRLPLVVAQPEIAWRDRSGRSFLLAKSFDFPGRSRHIVGIVVRDEPGNRHWVVTAYSARRLTRSGERWEPL